ncbi:TFIIE alpha subunit [Ceratocystis lukuohia]|uniref:Transcription initiation factor IIE subunit alpha n=2 Tax=Ceratocystis TaxID=5157 RepID=A0A2C5WZW5_9PEZI|nr:Transcription initiation factor IIE subunit alpha [Ceratocystis fimbriata CBS 114723]
MDLAQNLVRMVTRAFYETRHIIIVDAVITHSALRDNDLAYIMSMNIKDLHKLVGKLLEERLIHKFGRPELREGQTRPVTQTYYYIDYRQTLDAIKWRVYTITKDIQGNSITITEKKEYFCNTCGADYTNLEVFSSFDESAGFLCERCGSPLVHDLERNATGHEQSTRMNNQINFITERLQQIDGVFVPDNNFEHALANSRPVLRDTSNPGATSMPVDIGISRPTAVKGLANTGPKSLEVSISASDGPTDAEIAAEKTRKEKIAQQNALPSWMSNSTVTGDSFSANANDDSSLPVIKPEEDDKAALAAQADANKDHAAIDDYFLRLKEEQERLKLQDEEEGSDEDEDDFEDVVAAVTIDAPSIAVPDLDDGRLAKKVKLEEPVSDESEDDDMEFEDV